MAPRKKATPEELETPKASTKKASAKKDSAKKTSAKKIAKKAVVEEPIEEVFDDQEEVAISEEAPVQSQGSFLVNEKPTQWILVRQMNFGLINESFPVGSVFEVDWQNRKMLCHNNGYIYDNIKDLEIAIRIGIAEPYAETESQTQYIQQQQIDVENQQNKTKMITENRRNQDNQVRNMISRSDQDVIENIDIAHTRKTIAKSNIHVTPASEVTINKPRQANVMQVHYSDGAQHGQTVRSSNRPLVRDNVNITSTSAKPLSPVLSKRHDWDISKSGSIQADINKKTSDYSIKVDQHGQQYIRGLPVIRDDSEASGGYSRNEGAVTCAREALENRESKIEVIRSEKYTDLNSRRQNSSNAPYQQSANVEYVENQDYMPQDVEAGMGYDDSGMTPPEKVIPIEQPQVAKVKTTAGKLLRRRG